LPQHLEQRLVWAWHVNALALGGFGALEVDLEADIMDFGE
jgi:hypothetical protein